MSSLSRAPSPSARSFPDIQVLDDDADLFEALPPEALAPDDVFADERERLQVQTHALIGQAAVLRRQLTSLVDRQRRLVACGEPPAFDTGDDALAWLGSLPQAIFRATPPAGTVLEQAVARASAKFGAASVTLGASMCDVAMRLDTSHFSPRQLRALGLRPQGLLTVTAHFEPAYHLAPEPPPLTIEYSAPGGPPQVATSAIVGAKQHFRLGYQMLNVLTRHLQQTWSSGPTERALLDLLDLASKRLQTLPQHCVVCDQAINLAQLRPTTCHAPDCISQAETCGYGFEPQDILQNAEVADLLISMTAAAAAAGRDAFFQRLPMTFRTSGATDFKAMTHEINSLPAVQTLAHSHDMIGTLDAVSPTAVSTLSWLMISNEGFLEYLPKHQQCSAMGTPHQFRILGGPIEREIAFQSLASAGRSRFAFHGSPFGNWHSILRTGLVVGSSQSGLGFNGAAQGPGIYVSNKFTTSLGYSRAGIGWTHSRFGNYPICVALCETKGPSNTSAGTATLGEIESFANPHAVALRYLFVYPDATSAPAVHADHAAQYLLQHAEDADTDAFIKRRRAGWRPW